MPAAVSVRRRPVSVGSTVSSGSNPLRGGERSESLRGAAQQQDVALRQRHVSQARVDRLSTSPDSEHGDAESRAEVGLHDGLVQEAGAGHDDGFQHGDFAAGQRIVGIRHFEQLHLVGLDEPQHVGLLAVDDDGIAHLQYVVPRWEAIDDGPGMDPDNLETVAFGDAALGERLAVERGVFRHTQFGEVAAQLPRGARIGGAGPDGQEPASGDGKVEHAGGQDSDSGGEEVEHL